MSDLHRAIRRGDKEEIIRLIASGAPVNVVEERPFGYTTLMEACVCPATGTDVIKLLLDAGADANAWTQPEDKRRSEPFLKTVMYSITVEEAKLLIAAGADMNACSAKGSTALVTAAGAPFLAALSQRRNFEVFDFLLAAGASSASPGEFEHFITERLSYCGEIARLGKVLAMGEDPAPRIGRLYSTRSLSEMKRKSSLSSMRAPILSTGTMIGGLRFFWPFRRAGSGSPSSCSKEARIEMP